MSGVNVVRMVGALFAGRKPKLCHKCRKYQTRYRVVTDMNPQRSRPLCKGCYRGERT